MKKLFFIAIASLGMIACSEKNSPTTPVSINGALPGKFSVSLTNQIQFSQGNLQYQASSNSWRFAGNQWEIIGEGNKNISPTYSGWMDLFGWGTGNNPTNVSGNNDDYLSFIDWGVNIISNGGGKANMWRTLSQAEWIYLLDTRTNAEQLRGHATVNNIHGYIILPDDWKTPEGFAFKGGLTYSWDSNVYSGDNWRKMEAAGAVFLPAAGSRRELIVFDINTYGNYYTSTAKSPVHTTSFYFTSLASYAKGGYDCCFGRSVRLVQDIK